MTGMFVYEAMDRSGKPDAGVVEADSPSAAAHAVRARGLVVLSIREQRGAARKKRTRRSPLLRVVKAREVADFCYRLATLVKAGLGAAEGLETIGKAQEKGPFRRIILRMAERIRSGHSLSECMEEHPDAFPPLAARMVSAAEASGELPANLTRLARHIEKRVEVREQVLMSLLYPAIVILMASVVTVLMVAFVFPKFAEFLHQQNRELPLLANAMLGTAAFASGHGAWIMAGILGFILLLFLFYKTPPGRLLIHRLLLKLPALGPVFRASATLMWTRTLADLLRSGLSLQEALHVTAEVVPNREYGRCLERVRGRVMTGEGLGVSMERTSPLFDHLVCKLVYVGEESGTLEGSLEETARFAEGDLKRRVTVLAKLFEPAVIVVVGAVVGIVFITFFQTLYAYLPGN